ncbi:glycosyltransferase family 4 protein [Trinickia diaoshuihuensis]|uniref:glycosyltransferase family 4 protein n=1 Tax=Trinickia diaoshuihuensis TaxID=2292265 RepID=UPI000E285ADB|nr:glycosyltransferase family 4 protein [Trinickia diaoshuihuensis]
MRILQLVLAPRLSGAEVLVKGLAIAHRRGGHAVGIASLLPAEDDFADAACELAAHRVECRFAPRRYERLARLAFLYRTVRSFAPDILFAHTTIPALYARALPLSVPIVFVMHSGMNDFTENRWLRYVEYLLSRRARAVIGVSQRNVDQYAATIGLHGASFVVPNGVDAGKFRDCVSGRGANVEGGVQRIVQIGRYMPEKGQMETVRAFAQALAQRPNLPLRLHLCGGIEDRAYHARVVALVDRLGIGAYVVIDGPRTDVPELLAQADVFAMPSHFEAHSIGFLEGLASGVPIVASAIEAFAFAGRYAGVRLVDAVDPFVFGRALIEALEMPRSVRPLDGLTLEDTAARYLDIAQRVLA